MPVGEDQVGSTLAQHTRTRRPWKHCCIKSQVTAKGAFVSMEGAQMKPVVKNQIVQGSVLHAEFCNHPLGYWQTLKEIRQGA